MGYLFEKSDNVYINGTIKLFCFHIDWSLKSLYYIK